MNKGGHGASPGLAVKNREDSHRGVLAASYILLQGLPLLPGSRTCLHNVTRLL